MFEFDQNENIFQTLNFNSRDRLFNKNVINDSLFLSSIRMLINIMF